MIEMLLGNPIIWLLVFAVAIIIVLRSADLFVDNIVIVGTVLGISQIVLGVTAAAIGTSLPEFGSAIIASLSGNSELGVGVIVGANIWNIGGILGITAIVTGIIESDKNSISRDGLMCITTGLLLLGFMIVGYIIPGVYHMKLFWLGSIVMIIAYVYYMRILIKDEENATKTESLNSDEEFEDIIVMNKTIDKMENVSNIGPTNDDLNKKKGGIARSLLFIIISIIGLGLGCKLLVWSVESFGDYFNVSQLIMGLFVLALFTTLPELFVTLSSAMKGLHDISIGTVFGSITFNILIGLGLPALLHFNEGIPIELSSLYIDVPFMVAIISIALIIIRLNGFKLTRIYGIFIVCFYLAYVILRIGIVPILMPWLM